MRAKIIKKTTRPQDYKTTSFFESKKFKISETQKILNFSIHETTRNYTKCFFPVEKNSIPKFKRRHRGDVSTYALVTSKSTSNPSVPLIPKIQNS